jgi:hypothetical protein
MNNAAVKAKDRAQMMRPKGKNSARSSFSQKQQVAMRREAG